MKPSYKDILGPMEKMGYVPQWWDENAVPRFCEFHPHEVTNIYAKEVALVEIECQSCGEEFKVAFSQDNYEGLGKVEEQGYYVMKEPLLPNEEGTGRLSNYEIKNNVIDYKQIWMSDNVASLGYGDPPIPLDSCCGSGSTMTSVPSKVLEFWSRRDRTGGWVRKQELEIDIKPDWAKEDYNGSN